MIYTAQRLVGVFVLTKKLDKTDIHILDALQRNARVTNVELAEIVHLSSTACFNRVRVLNESGLIRSHVTLLDPDILGLRVNVFIHVSLEKQTQEAIRSFEDYISDLPEIMECYLMTGEEDYLLRVVVTDIHELELFILQHLTQAPGVANIRSSFALKQVRYKTALPLHSKLPIHVTSRA